MGIMASAQLIAMDEQTLLVKKKKSQKNKEYPIGKTIKLADSIILGHRQRKPARI
jgi:hypothetical protein